MSAEAVFTTAEVAEISGLQQVSVIWNITQKRLKATKRGGIWMITATDLETWLRDREKDAK